MKDTELEFTHKGKSYKLVFNLNVMQSVQKKYGSIAKWSELTDGTKEHEVDIEALIFGYTEMLNEGIDIDNEGKEQKKEFFTQKQVGRLVTEIGVENTISNTQKIVIESTETQSSKNV